jgi:hypothetical protein
VNFTKAEDKLLKARLTDLRKTNAVVWFKLTIGTGDYQTRRALLMTETQYQKALTAQLDYDEFALLAAYCKWKRAQLNMTPRNK